MSATFGKLMCIYNPLLGRGIHLLTALLSCQPRQVSCLPDSGLKFSPPPPPPRAYNGLVHAANMKARQKERKKERSKKYCKPVERNTSFRAYVSYT